MTGASVRSWCACYANFADDLDDLLREADRIDRDGLYTLRLLKLSGAEE